MHDLCAIAAMQGMCANSEIAFDNDSKIAQWSFKVADAMMNERNKRIHEIKTRKEQNDSTNTRT
jgi:hypothetical protein